jgi:peptide-methionine (S)-S-oxide reductase
MKLNQHITRPLKSSASLFFILMSAAFLSAMVLTAFTVNSAGSASPEKKTEASAAQIVTQKGDMDQQTQQAVFGGGCFWCTEAVFQRVKGVKEVVSGYAGGHVPDPTYRQVVSGTTGHAEVIRVTYNPDEVAYQKLLEIFFRTHNPTTLNRQGNDIGPQYRSIILYTGGQQKQTAADIRKALNDARIWDDPIVTEIKPLDIFYEAEEYHQNYFNRNREQGYCQLVIVPKIEKFKKLFEHKVAVD